MDWSDLGWKAGGVCLVALGAFLLVNRRAREWIARSMWESHAPIMERVPWLYGPKPLREWWFGEAGFRRQVVTWAIGVILIGVAWVLIPEGAER
jgi:hypothetical protein